MTKDTHSPSRASRSEAAHRAWLWQHFQVNGTQPRLYTLALFGTDEDLHRIHPWDFDNTAAHVQAEAEIAAEVLHSLGHQFRYVTLRWSDYLAWLQEHQMPDQPKYQLQWERSLIPEPILQTTTL